MIKKISKVLLISIAGAVVLAGCTSTGKDFTVDAARYATDRAEVWNRFSEVTPIVEDKLLEETATQTRVFFLIKNESYGGATNIISSVGLSSLERYAAATAAEKAGADGLYVIRTKRETTGFPLLFGTTKVTVWGKPIKYKVLGIMSEERSDLRRKIDSKTKVFGF